MSAYNLLIPFISACCWLVRVCLCMRACVRVPVCVWGRVCQRQMGVGGCVYVLEMSRSHLHWSLHPTGEEEREGGRLMPGHFLPLLSLALRFPTYARSVLSLSFSVSSVSYSPCIFLCLLSLHYNPPSQSISGCLHAHSQFLSEAVFYYSVIFYCANTHSKSILIFYSLTLSLCTDSSSVLVSSCIFLPSVRHTCQSGVTLQAKERNLLMQWSNCCTVKVNTSQLINSSDYHSCV